MTSIGDTTMQGLEYALGGVRQQLDVHANNLANANTPGFVSTRVDFATTLRDAVDRGDLDTVAAPAVENAMGLPDAQGNTVSLEQEVSGMMKANLMQRTLVNAYNFKVGVLRTAINGR